MARANRRQPKQASVSTKELGEAPSWLDSDQVARLAESSAGVGAPWPTSYSVPSTGYQGGRASQQAQQPQYPPMPQISPDEPPMVESGATGTAVFSGIITSEEYNPDFFWREAVRIYEQMRRNDYQVFSSLLMCELPIIRANWRIRPASDSPDDLDVASLVETALFHELEQPWTDVVRHALLMLSFGFSVMEKVFKVAEDGTVYWSKFAPRLPRTIWRWWIDNANELRGIQQWTFKNYAYTFIDIPAEKVMVFTNRLEGGNFEGVSVLRTAYKPWFYKEGLLRIMAIGFEREHVGVPVIKLPSGHTAADLTRAASIGKNIRANEQAYVTLPFGWDMDWLQGKSGGRASSHTPITDAIALMDVAISRNVLAQMQNLGSTETGSYALADVQNDFFLMSDQAAADYIANIFNGKVNGAIPQLVRYNFGKQLMNPQLVCDRIQSFDITAAATAVSNMSRFGVLTPDQGMEDWGRDLLGMPSAPHNPVQATAGRGQVDQSGAGGKQDEQQGGTRSKGGAGEVMAASIPPQYRTERFLHEMPSHQAHIYARMVQQSLATRRPYVVTDPNLDRLAAIRDAEEQAARRNRKVPDDPDYAARKEQASRRLLKNYRALESDLAAAAPSNGSHDK